MTMRPASPSHTLIDPSHTALARFNMIEQQIRPWNVLNSAVLELLSQLRREDFVPQAYQALAFADLEVPLAAGQCMLPPRVEARILQDLALQPHEKVLEIGAGSGFMAALLAQQAYRVVSLEIIPELAEMARANVQYAGIRNVDVRCADGAKGLAAEGPFDAIVLSGSVAEVPAALLAQLQVGGRLVAIVGEEPVMRASFTTRTGTGTGTGTSDFHTIYPWDTMAPRLQNFPERSRFTF